MKNVYVKYNTLSPISHLSPPMRGTTRDSSQRTLRIVTEHPDGKRIEDLPVVGGGSIRGKNRRKFIMKVLDTLGYYQNNLLMGLKQESFEALIAGGRQVQSTEQAARVEKYISLFDDLPFLGLFGGTPYSVFVTGRLSVGFALPMLKETAYLFKNSPYKDEEMPAFVNVNAFISENSYTRFAIKNIAEQDEVEFTQLITFLKQEGYEIAANEFEEDILAYNESLISVDEEAKLPSLKLPRLEKALKGDATLAKVLGLKVNLAKAEHTPSKITKKIVNLFNLRMIYTVHNPIPAGLNLHSIVGLQAGFGDDKLMEACFDAFVETVLEDRYIGGMHNKGYGQVIVEAKLEDGSNFMDSSTAEYFWEWLEVNKDKVKEILETLDKYLITPLEKAK